MEVVVLDTPDEVAKKAADHVCHMIKKRRSCALGLPTGSTPLGMYKELIARYERNEVDFSQAITFNLDEYVGLSPEHPSSYYKFMSDNFFNHINIPKDNIYIPNGMADDIKQECRDYEKALEHEGGIDLQILGIGRDGHIAFNEPSSSLVSRTRLKTLTEETRQDNAKNFSNLDEVPNHVITMGIGTIMDSRRIVMIATGESKAQAVADMVEGPVSAWCPASILQFHQRVTVIVDKDAASKLKRTDYYKTVLTKKPLWQGP